MRTIAFIYLLFMSPVLFACGSAGDDVPILICDDGVNASNVDSMKDSALSGSPDAAMALFWAVLDDGDKEGALFWSQIAMENGSKAGRHGHASLLMQRGDAASLKRARFHLGVLIKDGDKDAAVLLEKLDEMEGLE